MKGFRTAITWTNIWQLCKIKALFRRVLCLTDQLLDDKKLNSGKSTAFIKEIIHEIMALTNHNENVHETVGKECIFFFKIYDILH